MARALSNRPLRESRDLADRQADASPQSPLLRARRLAAQDWMSEFPQEPAGPEDPALWVEVPHPPLAPPPHTEFRPFSPVRWIQTHRSLAGAAVLIVGVMSAAVMGLAAWMQRDPQQEPAVVTKSTTSEPLLARPNVTPPPAPSTLFTSQAAAPPPTDAAVLPPARGGASASADVTKPEPRRPTASRDRAGTPPARVADATAGRATTAPKARGFVPPLPPPIPAARAADRPPPPTVTDSNTSSSSVVTSRPPIDRAALILPSALREPAASAPPPPPAASAAPAGPPPPSPEARETTAVETVLERYRLAFSTLNSGVSDFWPGVNSRALDKAFNELDEQRFEFDQCRVELQGAQADATCRGSATFVPKVGNKTPRTQPRQWTFRLVKAGNRWIIDSVQSR
jgi:hypothetical protein